MGRIDGKVAFITGVARGQGRSHAVRLAQEGANIIGIDVCQPISEAPYGMGSEADLHETALQVEATGRRAAFYKADVRDVERVKDVLADGVQQLGRLDIVSANAGIGGIPSRAIDISEPSWATIMDVNLSGVWHTVKAAVPHIVTGGNGGSVVLTSSTAGLRPYENIGAYVTAKHGLVGLMRVLALELGPQMIRVNSIHPTQVNTPMIMKEDTYRLFRPDLDEPTLEDMKPASQTMHTLPIPWVEAIDISNALLFLASDEARYITGTTLSVDAGAGIK